MKRTLLLSLFAGILLVGCKKQEPLFETEQLTAVQTVYLTAAQKDSLFVSFEIEYPVQMADTLVLNNVRTDLKARLFGERYALLPAREAMRDYIAVLRQEYLRNNLPFAHTEDGDQEPYATLCEEQILVGRVVALTDKVLSYGIEQYVYMGGAHGMNSNHYHNYCLATGAHLVEADLLVEDYAYALSALLRRALVEQSAEFSSSEEMQSAGYDFDNVRPNGNFFFSEEGLTWSYTPYEIAPYAFGETEIFVPWELLESEGLLRSFGDME